MDLGFGSVFSLLYIFSFRYFVTYSRLFKWCEIYDVQQLCYKLLFGCFSLGFFLSFFFHLFFSLAFERLFRVTITTLCGFLSIFIFLMNSTTMLIDASILRNCEFYIISVFWWIWKILLVAAEWGYWSGLPIGRKTKANTTIFKVQSFKRYGENIKLTKFLKIFIFNNTKYIIYL